MNKTLRACFTVIALLISVQYSAFAAGPVTVSKAWVRATVPAQQVTGAFMTLSANDMRLIAARTPLAESVEIHEMSMDNNMMKMRQLSDGVFVPSGKSVELKPGGVHLMLMGLKQPMKAGTRVALTLTFLAKDKKRSTVKVDAEVKEITAMGTSDSGMAH